MLCDSIYLKFKNKHRSLTVTESEQELPLGSEALMEKGHDWGPGTLSPPLSSKRCPLEPPGQMAPCPPSPSSVPPERFRPAV